MDAEPRQRATWSSVQEVALSILPVFLVAIIAFGTWVTSELYSAQYAAATALREGVRIEADAKEYATDKYATLLSEINRLRGTVDNQTIMLAELLAEVKNLKEQQK